MKFTNGNIQFIKKLFSKSLMCVINKTDTFIIGFKYLFLIWHHKMNSIPQPN